MFKEMSKVSFILKKIQLQKEGCVWFRDVVAFLEH